MAYNLANFHKELLEESPPLVRDYLQYQLTVRARSPLTVEEYARDLMTFFRFIKRYSGQVPADTPDKEIRFRIYPTRKFCRFPSATCWNL